MTVWLGNVRYPPETMPDLSDEEWLNKLWAKYGQDRIHVGPPQDGGTPWHCAEYWDRKGMVGIYVDEEALREIPSEEVQNETSDHP